MGNDLFIREGRKGRGVYTARIISYREVVIVDPVLVFPEKEARAGGVIHRYTFEWGDEKGVSQCAIALGYGSLLNHSYKPNLTYSYSFTGKTLTFKALRFIQADEELTINYNHDPEDKSPLDFKVIEC